MQRSEGSAPNVPSESPDAIAGNKHANEKWRRIGTDEGEQAGKEGQQIQPLIVVLSKT